MSAHPLVVKNFADTLKPAGLEILERVLESTLAPALRAMEVPQVTVFVLDAAMPYPSVEALTGRILESVPKARIIVATERLEEKSSFALLRMGVKGLIPYSQTREQLAHAVPKVASGGYWVPREILSQFVESIMESPQGQKLKISGTRELSSREQQILDLLLENLANKEIASKLNISERTVKFHVSNILAKFGVGRRADLILLCYQKRAAA